MMTFGGKLSCGGKNLIMYYPNLNLFSLSYY
jgi:hypothetical protein